MRIGFLVETDHGNCAGHFFNDVEATLEDAAQWIINRQLNQLTEGARLVGVALYGDDHTIIYSRRS